MTPSDHTRRWPWLTAGFVAVVLLLYGSYRGTLVVMVHNAEEELRSKGYPITMEELNDWYSEVPPEKNAALLYREAYHSYKNPSVERHNLLPYVGNADAPTAMQWLTEQSREAGMQHLARNKGCLELLHRAAERADSRYPVTLEEERGVSGLRFHLPHLPRLRQMGHLLTLQAVIRAAEGKGSKAAAAVTALLHLARSLRNEPTMDSQNTRIRIQAEACEALWLTLNRGCLSETELAMLQKEFSEAEKGLFRPLRRGMIGGMCLALSQKEFQEYINSTSIPPSTWTQLFGEAALKSGAVAFSKIAGFRQLDRLTALRHYREIAEVADLPRAERINAIWQLAHKDLHSGLSAWNDLLHPLLDCLPESYWLWDRQSQVKIRLRLAETATAVARFSLKTGRLPDGLSELCPEFMEEVPKDLWGGEPVGYKTTSEGYMIYSVGPDEEEDPDTRAQTGWGQGDDIAFKVWTFSADENQAASEAEQGNR